MTPDHVSMERLRWRCRRGLLELDIVLGRFIETQYHRLGDTEKMLFEVMLDMPDNPLWDMIAGRTDAENNEQQALLELIRSV